MLADKNIGFTAALIGESSRAAILMALMDGSALPASELAWMAKVSPQTASSHLSKLLEGGLISVETFGRHRYYKIRNEEIAQELESLLRLAPKTPLLNKMLADEKSSIRQARTCYDHLAGKLGVQITMALIEKAIIVPENNGYLVTTNGENWFMENGFNLAVLRQKRRLFANQCLDWTERKPHLAGSLGTEFLNKFFKEKWITKVKNSRAIRITRLGEEMFRSNFGITI